MDIDGVIVLGKKVISGAADAISRLRANNVPFICVTNGGEVMEEEKAAKLSQILGVEIFPHQVVLSHTPMKDLVPQYANSRVLVIGNDNCLEVARSYGFTRVVGVDHIHSENHLLHPKKDIAGHVLKPDPPTHEEPVVAAFVFGEPTDWALCMQVLSDLMHDDDAHPLSNIPLFTSNSDIVYTNEYHKPRFTQGAFVEAYKHLFEHYSGKELNITRFGKPFPIQYKYAQECLARECDRTGLAAPSAYFAVGDNPKSDVRGANSCGMGWTSILVRTGVFKGKSPEDNDPIDPADVVVDSIIEAVDYIVSIDPATAALNGKDRRK